MRRRRMHFHLRSSKRASIVCKEETRTPTARGSDRDASSARKQRRFYTSSLNQTTLKIVSAILHFLRFQQPRAYSSGICVSIVIVDRQKMAAQRRLAIALFALTLVNSAAALGRLQSAGAIGQLT